MPTVSHRAPARTTLVLVAARSWHRALRRRLKVVAILGAAALVAGCSSGPSYSPTMPGIPEARTAASAVVDRAAQRITFSDQVTMVGEGRADGCGSIRSDDVLFGGSHGYFCVMGWMVALVVPNALTREEVAGAIDAEMRAMDITYPYSLAEDLVLGYPSILESRALMGSGSTEGLEVRVEATPFEAASWRAPRIPHPMEVSHDGDLETITAKAIEATGADEVITVSVTTEYWNSFSHNDRPADQTPTLRLETYSEGSVLTFDIADPAPAAAGEACARDIAVDASTVTPAENPFPRLTFSLGPESTSEDMQRVRDCLTSGLTSGAIAIRSPHE